ncbi:acetylhydrolase [Amycolatopsis sp. BJA-103]|uniref:alpha/beta hydrolase family protein n=1 Tax=Amycolatopsis sp. BJA-103 TaxID=1911175 RepID=UPI000C765EB1|nr:acetylhydrolase [Amycolatopsis sp. BJA-103]AUI63807.1 acetylhydrolase [Amycolatopsis sp. BJA-103]PNE16216.1 acetylhydrolase [Amycolatopsis sp. BJA-103]
MKSLMVLVAVIAGLLGVPAAASAAPDLSLPAPGGPVPIGLRTLHLTDRARADPWVPEKRRELMVNVWYPAFPVGRAPLYMTHAESAAAVAGRKLDLPPDTLSKVRVHSRENAPSLPGRRPLVLLSPGAGNNRITLTAMAERLASQGFVVAGIDHAHEAWATEFPDGLRQCVACGRPDDPWPAAIANRAIDTSFVIDTLLKDSRWSIDAAKIGMAGHSAGGSATAAAMAADRRIKAGVNIDGPFYGTVSLDRPLLLLTSPIGEKHFGPTWDETWPRLTGPKERFLVEDSGHSSVTDAAILIDQLGLRPQIPPTEVENQYGSIDSRKALDFFRDRLTGFFKQWSAR